MQKNEPKIFFPFHRLINNKIETSMFLEMQMQACK